MEEIPSSINSFIRMSKPILAYFLLYIKRLSIPGFVYKLMLNGLNKVIKLFE